MQLEKAFGGVSIYDFMRYVDKGGTSDRASEQEIFNKITENEFLQEVVDLCHSMNLVMGDIVRANSWGVVKRDGENQVVLIDYGITKDDLKNYYNNGVVRPEYRKI